MSTTPNPVTPPTAALTINPVSVFLKAHERLIIILIAGLLFAGLYSRVLTYLANHDQAVSTKAQAVLQAQLQANQDALADEKQQTAQYEQLTQQVLQSEAALASAAQQRQQQTVTQQHLDSTLQPADLISRWDGLTNISPGVIIPTATGYSVTPSAAITTVQSLEEVPKLTADLAGQKQTTQDEINLVAGLTKVNTSLTGQVSSLNQTITDQSKACSAQVNVLKAEARKSKLKWFSSGLVVGFVGGLLAKL